MVWTVPLGRSSITAYDLRYIEADATDKYDSRWTVTDPAGTPVSRTYTLRGLADGVADDVQARAIDSSHGEGTWSATGTAIAARNTAPYFEEGESTTRLVPENSVGGSNVGAPKRGRKKTGRSRHSLGTTANQPQATRRPPKATTRFESSRSIRSRPGEQQIRTEYLPFRRLAVPGDVGCRDYRNRS